jgi:hypothetical protein
MERALKPLETTVQQILAGAVAVQDSMTLELRLTPKVVTVDPVSL